MAAARHRHGVVGWIVAGVLVAVLSGAGEAQASGRPWEIKTSDHFIIYFHEASTDTLDRLIAHAEAYYHQLTEQLGFTRFDGFWTWDQRAKIYLYDTRDDYQRLTGQPQWSEAGARVREREIHTYVNMVGFFETLLPHELGHIIFREFIGSERPLPLWLDEGIACFLEERTKAGRLATARAIVRTARFRPLEALTQVRRETLTDPEAFYAEAASVIEFLFRSYGRERFVEYCRRLRARESWDGALTSVYGFQSLAEMNGPWVAFLNEPSMVHRP